MWLIAIMKWKKWTEKCSMEVLGEPERGWRVYITFSNFNFGVGSILTILSDPWPLDLNRNEWDVSFGVCFGSISLHFLEFFFWSLLFYTFLEDPQALVVWAFSSCSYRVLPIMLFLWVMIFVTHWGWSSLCVLKCHIGWYSISQKLDSIFFFIDISFDLLKTFL